MKRARVEGLERLKAKISRLPPAAKRAMAAANEKSAQRMWAAARIALPRGEPRNGHLEDTLRVEKGQTETGYLTKVGGAGQPYPLSLEAGHLAPDGSKVPPHPFWYPTRRKVVKEHQSRMPRLLKAVVAEIVK